MTDSIERRSVTRSRPPVCPARAVGALLCTLGAAEIVFSMLGASHLETDHQTSLMAPLTGLSFVALGLSTALATGKATARFAAAIATVPVFIAAVAIGFRFAGRAGVLKPDMLPGLVGHGIIGHPMTLGSVLCATSAGLGLRGLLRQRPVRSVQLILLPGAATAWLNTLGYLYDVRSGHAIADLTAVALHSALAYLVLFAGLFCVIPNGLVAQMRAQATPGATLNRRVLPIVVFGLPLTGWLHLYGQQQNWFSASVGLSIIAILAVSIVSSVILWASHIVDRSDASRTSAFAALRVAHANLEERVEDRTARLERVNQELEESENRFRSLVEASPLGMYRLDKTGVIAFVNQPWCEIYRTTNLEAIGRRVPPNLHPEFAEGLTKRMIQLMAKSDTATQEFRLLLPNGSTPHLRAHLAAVRGSAGELTGWVGTVEDITDSFQRQRRDSVAQAIGHHVREDLEIDSMLERAVAAVGAEFDVTRVGLRLLDPGPHSLGFAQWARAGQTVLPPADGLLTMRLAKQALDQGWPLEVADFSTTPGLTSEVRAVWQRLGLCAGVAVPIVINDALFAVLTLAKDTPHHWDDDDRTGLAAAATEIANALMLAGLHDQQRQVAQRLEQLDATKHDFVASVTHELRTPLTSVVGYLDLILDGDVADTVTQHDMLRTVRRNAQRLSVFVDDLLALSRLDAELPPALASSVALSGVIGDIATAMNPIAHANQLELKVAVENHLPFLQGDPKQIEQIVQNLVSNAIKFTPAGGVVRICARSVANNVELAVSDTGIGIPLLDQSQLFERFFRSTNAQAAAVQGTGLGLAIVAQLVDSHGGSIHVESAEGAGTTMTVTFPIRAEFPGAAVEAAAVVAQPV